MSATAKTHLELSTEIKTKLDRPISEFIANQAAVRKNHNGNMEKIQKNKSSLAHAVQKSRERYETKCNEVVMLEQAKLVAEGKEHEKIRIKLEKVQVRKRILFILGFCQRG
jgi:predicted metal-dependent hydrolase